MKKNKKPNWFKRLRYWFMSKRATVKFIKEIMEINELEISMVVKKLEGLDQDKLYIAEITDATPEDLKNIAKGFMIAANRLNWTTPQVLFVNKEITITEKPKGSVKL